MEKPEDILLQLYNDENISIGIHGTAILPDREQQHAKNILENGLMCRYGDIRRTVSFQDRGMIHAHGNIAFSGLISYKYCKQQKGYLAEDKVNGKMIIRETKEIDLEQCSFIVAIPKEMSTIDDEIFSGPKQTFEREFANSIDDLRIGIYKENQGRPINPKYIVGYYMNGDISSFTFNSEFYGLEYDEKNHPHLNLKKIQEENERMKRLNEQKVVKETQQLGKETIKEQNDTNKFKHFIKSLLERNRNENNTKERS